MVYRKESFGNGFFLVLFCKCKPFPIMVLIKRPGNNIQMFTKVIIVLLLFYVLFSGIVSFVFTNVRMHDYLLGGETFYRLLLFGYKYIRRDYIHICM